MYRDVLEENGFAIKQLSPGSAPSGCALSTTYVGNWSWDLALNLSHADIKVFDMVALSAGHGMTRVQRA